MIPLFSRYIVKVFVFFYTTFSLPTTLIDGHKSEINKKKYIATYYADKFNNRKTATGDKFHNDSLSVATSDNKFFNKKILFQSIETGKKLLLYCNDKMHPRLKGKIHFDLSKKAMQVLSNKKEKYPGHISLYVLKVIS